MISWLLLTTDHCNIIILCFWVLFLAKMARLKQAKEEAEREIAEFRVRMEKEFQRKVAEVKRKDRK